MDEWLRAPLGILLIRCHPQEEPSSTYGSAVKGVVGGPANGPQKAIVRNTIMPLRPDSSYATLPIHIS